MTRKGERRGGLGSARPRRQPAASAGKRPAGSRKDGKSPSRTSPTSAVVLDEAPVIVAVGGSAGSLTPLRQLFGAFPPDSGLAFVVVSHQSPTGQSLLPEILAKTTAMPVREIEGEIQALPNHVYVAPRGHSVTVRAGVLAIEPIGEPSRVPLPVDHFFCALARDRGPRSVGIVLSGTGSDGTLGLAAIRAESGLCLAQDPETAEFDGMPTSAIGAQAVDLVLPVEEMPERLIAYARFAGVFRQDAESFRVSPNELERILSVIRTRAGHDFSAYKRDTLLRRIQRRMGLHRIESLGDYARYLEENDEEIDALWRDWLIGVSSFFRDPEAFQALAESGLPALLAARAGDHRLRVWVPGCATGEEAYSIAMLVIEASKALGERFDIQVFATDLDSSAIRIARAGRYPKAIAKAVGARRLDRFFVEQPHGYRAKKELRDRIVFAVQDVLHDPPFTRVDLISCRNLLIYVVPSAQQVLLSTFHYSLNPGGLLLLGASEHAGASGELFTALDKRWKLFQRNDSVAAHPPLRSTPRTATTIGRADGPSLAEGLNLDLSETLRTRLAERFGPPAVVVDFRGQIEQTHGRVGAYLELPPGRANLNVVDMAREGLRAPLASGLRAIAKGSATRVEKDVRLKTDRGWRSLRLTMEKIEGRRLPSPLVIVSFEPASRRGRGPVREPSSQARRSKRAQLERDLEDMRQDLELSVSDLQAANEELASANEEVQSANEELQSSNEELQTSKEETQSLNEELQTVNAELAEKLRGLEQANDDLLNLMVSIEIATIFLDNRLRVKRFTPQARNVSPLIESDVGRPLADLATVVDYPNLLADAEQVLATLRPVEKQARAPDGIWYSVRIRPYRTTRNAVEGLVVTFIDITETKRAELSQAARLLADNIIDAVHEPLLILDPTLLVVRANRSFYRTFRVEPAGTEGRPLTELDNRRWSIPRLHDLLEGVLRDGVAFENYEVDHDLPHLGRRRMVLSGRPVFMPDLEEPALIVLGIRDAGRAPAAAPGEDVET